MARVQLQGLSEPMFYLLLALRTPQYGYSIMRIVTQISNGRVTIGAGTLYALLSRFESEKIIQNIENDGRRKTYSLTAKGQEILVGEYNRLKAMISDADNCGRGHK